MTSKKDEKLTPFEQAEQNIRIFSQNIRMYECLLTLVETLEKIETAEDSQKEVLEDLFDLTLESFSEFLQNESGEWN